MPILKEQLFRYAMPDTVKTFLDSTLAKIMRGKPDNTGFRSITLDELYGILPSTFAARHGRNTGDKRMKECIEKWDLSEILLLKNPWDNLQAVFWKQDGNYYCMELSLFQREWQVASVPTFNQNDMAELFPVVVRRMNLIASAFGNTPLRQIGVRQYVHGILEKAVKNDERNFLLEMFLTLFNLELSPDEYDNQDIFLDRAKIHCSQIVAVRGECGVPAEFHQLAGLAAARGSYLLYNQFYTSANMVWGFLVNCKVLNDGNILPEGKFCFKELYGTNGHIEIGEIYPVGDEITSALHIQPDGDCYTQVFPDYETALKFRSVALTLVHEQNRRQV